ncbi:14844_t:CDS:2 [Acaulospora morrowiae]|uniref:14844_t:CDS:1 n=1 Tax=Acaulospora morrowiae TaxID=94023 RepID=A0A9N8WAJ9_9GLOM|nr:14844_t:CDS:2 [Acaulospora morrowiae]
MPNKTQDSNNFEKLFTTGSIEQDESNTSFVDELDVFENISSTIPSVLSSITVIADTFSTLSNSPVTNFLPLIGEIFKITSAIIKIYQTAQLNKRTCGALVERVLIAEAAVKNLEVLYEKNKTFFTAHNLVNFSKFVLTMKRIQSFAGEISQLGGIRKYLHSKSIEQTFIELIRDFDGHMSVLNFSLTISNTVKAESDMEILRTDNEVLKKYLEQITNTDGNILGVVEEIRTLVTVMEKNGQKKSGQFNRRNEELNADKLIPSSEFGPASEDLGKSVQKRYRKSEKVNTAFIEVKEESSKRSIQDQVHILTKIRDIHEIIRFYGLVEENGRLYIVTEWAEFGSFKDFYLMNRNKIDIDLKISIALDVVRGLNFLNSASILHHDVRPENIMITLQKRAKIANFFVSRFVDGLTTGIQTHIGNVRYMAPEKLANSHYKYDVACEVYSFGILMWEIAELKPPYRNIHNISAIQELVVKKKRREVFSPNNDIPKKWKELVENAWKHDPRYRPTFPDMFLTLQELYHQKNELELNQLDTDPKDDEIEDEIFSYLTVEEAIEEHKSSSGNKRKSWESFHIYAELGDLKAKYWKAYFLYYNILKWKEGELSERERMAQAAALFKEASDEGEMGEAQLRYANCLYHGNGVQKDRKLAVEYYLRSVQNGNVIAAYNVGKLLYRGSLPGVKKNIQDGEKYLRLAAYKNFKEAIEMCKKYNIEY